MNLMQIKVGYTTELFTCGGMPEQVHVFDQQSIDAINAALAAGRPLLVRGEPGTGKSQLARAAAKVLGRVFVSYVVDSRTESRDLLWQFDAVSRLAEAQLSGALNEDPQQARDRLEVINFVAPGPLWWAFAWNNASDQAAKIGQAPYPQTDGGKPDKGCVVLVDEIDKAESDVPNGLLEALGIGQFTPMGRQEPVSAGDPVPLVIITTNEERRLPDAFVRRCMVLHLQLPASRDKLLHMLIERGRAHFPETSEEVLREAA
jgi:MoxR-like ATPase